MGTAKALLDAGGVSFLSRTIRTLKEGGCRPVFVVVADESGAIAAQARAEDGLVLLNPDPASGPISSLQAGIRALPKRTTGLVFSPVDHPLVLASTVQSLIREFVGGDAPVVIPAYRNRRGHPVLFRSDLFPELLEADLPAGARTVIRRYLQAVAVVPVDDPGILADIDDWNRYRRHFS
jgi:CTP:molybdopterin cytidylyltransferase MocA